MPPIPAKYYMSYQILKDNYACINYLLLWKKHFGRAKIPVTLENVNKARRVGLQIHWPALIAAARAHDCHDYRAVVDAKRIHLQLLKVYWNIDTLLTDYEILRLLNELGDLFARLRERGVNNKELVK